MNVSLSVRRAIPSDKASIVALCHAIHPEDFVPEMFDEFMDPSGPGDLYVAEQDGQVIACYAVDFHAPGQAYLYAMRVHPATQGQGIGSTLCRYQVEQAHQLGAREIFLLSTLENERAHRTVTRCGFVNRGGWLVCSEITDLPELPVGQARLATPSDQPLIAAFRQRHAETPLGSVLSSRYSCWAPVTANESDWELGEQVLVAGPEGLTGLMLLVTTQEGLLIRWLQATPQAAADLLGYAVQRIRKEGLPALSLGLPLALEPLLAPLGLRSEAAFRSYLFHHPHP